MPMLLGFHAPEIGACICLRIPAASGYLVATQNEALNSDEGLFLVQQIGHFAGFAVNDSRGLRRRVDRFLVPFYFDGDVAILAQAFNSLDNGQIGTGGDEQAKGNYEKKSGQVPHPTSLTPPTEISSAAAGGKITWQ